MRFLNTKTGNTVESDCVLCGGNWIKVEETNKAQLQKGQKKTQSKKKKSDGE